MSSLQKADLRPEPEQPVIEPQLDVQPKSDQPNLQCFEYSAASYEGPIPLPEAMAAYERAVPGLATKIFDLAHGEAIHRRHLQEQVITSNIRRQDAAEEHAHIEAMKGQNYGLIIALSGIAFGGILAWGGHPIVGSVFSGGVLVSLVSVFIFGRAGKPNGSEKLTKDEVVPIDVSEK